MDDCPQLDATGDQGSESAESSANEVRRGELRAAVERGLEDIKAGRVVDVEEAFGRIEAMLDELEAAKRG